MNTRVVSPAKENKHYEIEVYVAWTAGGTEPYVSAGVSGGKFEPYEPNGDKVERYVFEVERPYIDTKKLKGRV